MEKCNAPIVEMEGPQILDWQRHGLPDPRTPPQHSSIISFGLHTQETECASMNTGGTTITVPDALEGEGSFVEKMAVKNPFTPPIKNPFVSLIDNTIPPQPVHMEQHVFIDDSLSEGRFRAFVRSSSDRETGNFEPQIKEKQDDFDYPDLTEDEDSGEDDSDMVSEAVESLEEDETIETAVGKAFENATERIMGRAETTVKVSTGIQQVGIKEEKYEDEDIAMMDANPNDQIIDDGQSVITECDTTSNWDAHEVVEQKLGDYESVKQSINGQEQWTEAQAKLHKLLALRGAWPMFDRTWTFHFKDREIYPWVYAPEGNTKRVAISAKSGDFRAAKALESLFDLSPLVASYRQTGLESKTGTLIRKTLDRYINWAIRDAAVADRSFIPTMAVYEFDTAAWLAKSKADGLMIKEEDLDHEVDDEDTSNDSNPISDEIETRLRHLAARHREELVSPKSKHLPEHMWTYREQPPLVYAFMIIQHMVMVINLDSSAPNKNLVIYAEFDMSLPDQWLWNALALALPVNMARDDLWSRRERMAQLDIAEVDDPDA